MRAQIFEQLRQIPALHAAERAGLVLRQRGARYWARCPASGEKTASLVIYPDGGWQCFSCNTGGDAAALYAHLYGLQPIEAACRLAQDLGIQTDKPSEQPKPTVSDLKKGLFVIRDRALEKHKDARKKADDLVSCRAAACGFDAWGDRTFVVMLTVRASADIEIDILETASVDELADAAIGGHLRG